MNRVDRVDFAYDEGGRLCAEQCDLERVAESVGTPTFVYTHAGLVRNFCAFDAAFSGHEHLICYSVKANSNLALLRLLASHGSGADIVSGGELMRARAAGIPAERIVFSGVGKTEAELVAGLDAQILAFNVESEMELDLLNAVAGARGKKAPVSLRVNPDIDAKTHPYIATGLMGSKFGIPIGQARRIAQETRLRPHLRFLGIDCHIGSQLTDLSPLLEALDSVLHLADALKSDGHVIEEIDLGGGLGITYNNETPPNPADFGRAVVQRLRGRSERLILEPGRVIVGNAGLLLTRVLYVKQTDSKIFVIVDAAMNDLLRPSLYGAHHEIRPLSRHGERERPLVHVDVVGPICESGDFLAQDRMLPAVKPGELLAIMSAGAYGFSMASNYNSRAKAAEVLVKGAAMHPVRLRERLETLTAGESAPDWL